MKKNYNLKVKITLDKIKEYKKLTTKEKLLFLEELNKLKLKIEKT
jgi:ABC-type Na+ transport system ATPase subunit NatA